MSAVCCRRLRLDEADIASFKAAAALLQVMCAELVLSGSCACLQLALLRCCMQTVTERSGILGKLDHHRHAACLCHTVHKSCVIHL